MRRLPLSRSIAALTLALAAFGCAQMKDSAAGGQAEEAPRKYDPVATKAMGGNTAPRAPADVSGTVVNLPVSASTARLQANRKGDDGEALQDEKEKARGDVDGDGLVVGRGSGGMGMRGTGEGGGGRDVGRLGGLGGLDSGGGKHGAERGVIAIDEIAIEGRDDDRTRGPRGRRAFDARVADRAKAEESKKKSESKVAQALLGERAQAEQAAQDSEDNWGAKPQPAPAQAINDLLVTELEALNQESTIRPQYNDGQINGLKLGNIRLESGMYRVGLRSGDVLRGINGTPIDSADKALAPLAGKSKPGTVTLSVERDGRFRTILIDADGKQGGDAGPLDAGLADADRWQIDDDAWAARPTLTEEPVKTLPRMFYFENTYLGRTAAFQERLRRLDGALSNPQAYVHTALDPQRLDAPTDAGLSVTTALDRAHPTEPGRVFLQVALQGSQRYGWRRPPLDLAVILDPHAMAHAGQKTRRMLDQLLKRLGPQDRLGVVLATDPPRVLVDVQDLRSARDALRSLDGNVATGGTQIAAAMRLAGQRLAAISEGQARVPGSQTLLVLTNGRAQPGPAAQVAHALTVQGAVTSVIDLSDRWDWWSVANAGHGQLYSEIDVAEAVDAELDRASKVVARLLRVNIKLAAGVRAVRVLGSRMLEDEEVKAVKAREVATDLQISKTMGVKADRGDDDDGIQTVIPFFYGGDAHVILVELWIDQPRRGMPVAEVSLRYKDMVALGNATARSHATLDTLSGPTTPAELMVRRNVRGFELAEALGKASSMVARGETDAARRLLDQAVAVSSRDRRLVDNLRALLARSVDVSVKQAALAYAGQRRISHVAAGPTP